MYHILNLKQLAELNSAYKKLESRLGLKGELIDEIYIDKLVDALSFLENDTRDWHGDGVIAVLNGRSIEVYYDPKKGTKTSSLRVIIAPAEKSPITITSFTSKKEADRFFEDLKSRFSIACQKKLKFPQLTSIQNQPAA